MPPKQRSASKAHSKAKSSSNRGGKSESSDERTPPSPEQLHVPEEGRRRERKVKWSPVFKKIGYVSLIFLVPAILNYAALNQESRMLLPKGSQ